MSPSMHQAMHALRQTGYVRLRGAPAAWSKLTGGLLKALIGLICVVAVGGVVVSVVMMLTGTWPGGAALFGLLGALVLLGGVTAIVILGLRGHKAYLNTEQQPVVLEARGLTMRGIGPIPWSDFGLAERRMVPAERSDGYARRAVMELTPQGLFNVNERTAPELRERISPVMGPFWNRHHRYLYVPGVEGLSQREVIELLNTAQRMFGVNR